MLTRYAAFVGELQPGMAAEMRTYVETELAPMWRQFSGAAEVRAVFGVESDAAGPTIPLMLAVDYPDADAMARGLASPARHASRDLLPAFNTRFFEHVQLLHYVGEFDADLAHDLG